jgi:hypothetical protein
MKYTGELTYHTEMCCGAWPQFHDYRGLHGDEKQYWNWDWTINFGKQTKIKRLTLFDNDGIIHYDGPWTFSRKNTAALNYFSAPKEIEPIKWWKIIHKKNNLKAEVITDEIVDALKSGEKK